MSNDKVKIAALELENVKRVKAVAIDCNGRSLVTIGGRNGQGKSSVIDAIAWTLGGDKFKPSNPVHAGAEEAYTKVVLSNGYVVERKGKNGSLKVTAPGVKSGGQTILNGFVNQFALNLPAFMKASGLEKAKMLLECFPSLGPKVQKFNEQIKDAYGKRHVLGQIADQKAKYAKEMPYDPEAPDFVLSGSDMAKRLQGALAHNARNQAIRSDMRTAEANVTTLEFRAKTAAGRVSDLEQALIEARSALDDATAQVEQAKAAVASAKAATLTLQDQDTTMIEQEMAKIDSLNARVRMNESKKNAEDEAGHLREQYQAMSAEIETMRAERLKLLASVKMPLPDLSIDEEGELIYRGQRWDCMADSERMQVGTAICAAVQPSCGFVLLDMLEKLDPETLEEFGTWLAMRGLQAIGTRVSTGDECSIIIEDGMVKGEETKELDI